MGLANLNASLRTYSELTGLVFLLTFELQQNLNAYVFLLVIMSP